MLQAKYTVLKLTVLKLTVLSVAVLLTACGGSPTEQAATLAASDSDTTCGIANFQVEFLAQINTARQTGAVCGDRVLTATGALSWSEKLRDAANLHSQDMADNNYFAHESPTNGSTLRERIQSVGYDYKEAGENLAAGQTTIAKVVADWMKSPNHCANLLNPVFTDMGASCKRSNNANYKTYWTLEMAQPG
jgi:uncharacterized protein YkwD